MHRTIAVLHTDDGFSGHLLGVNLAVSLLNRTKDATALIDASFSGRTATDIYLSGTPFRRLLDIKEKLDSLDDSLFSGYLTRHHSGIFVLGGEDVSEAHALTPEELSCIVTKTGSAFTNSVIIAPGSHDQHLLAVLKKASFVILPVMPHLLSLKKAKDILGTLAAWHFPISFVKIILRKAENIHGFSREAVSEFMKMDVYSEIELDQGSLFASINMGEPLLLQQPLMPFSSDVKHLANRLLEEKLAVSPMREIPFSQGTAKEDFRQIKEAVRNELIAQLDPKVLETHHTAENDLRNKVRGSIQEILARRSDTLSREERGAVIEELLNDVLGLGCLEPLLHDERVSEVMVNGPESIYIEKEGKISHTDATFHSESQLMTVIDRIVLPLGRRVDQASPIVDARLSDGSRVNAVIPPVSLSGPVLTIRKFFQKKLGIPDLVRAGAMTKTMAAFLSSCVKARKNIVISGGTGSGKTTLLNSVAGFIPSHERIITIEDAAELQLPQEHVVRLEARPPSIEGSGAIPIRRLVINALRMRPDRIIVGECRGGEALDMLQAMNTGHDGSLTTLHANSPKDSIARIVTMALMADAALSEKAIREQAAAALHIIVQLSRLPDGSRKVIEIAELHGLESGAFELQPLFVFQQTGIVDGKVTGTFSATGNVPSFYDGLISRGIDLPRDIFQKGAAQ